ncbi:MULTISPECIES: hypothetical protein [unclassified Pseudomonas]|uniref:hypothetical protein n=1 Tax=unclassified Pseudomonas TaxID=196821 RepID=UPI0024485B67|nr:MULTISPECIES: hypothetical protein [unclassified Pseudomonas]MDG9927378.1 hypothetical protein [Pseudomonas sp. GD04042]MDH0482447.1 hypothetical protein [Pseudomonas sp. GD04015]MDH0602799.1 hypothetical protein [Pseudomonas sp. GD03869]
MSRDPLSRVIPLIAISFRALPSSLAAEKTSAAFRFSILVDRKTSPVAIAISRACFNT